MATFNGCRAEGNRLGGFVTTNPNSSFIDCEAVNNGGLGFLDLSASTEVGKYIEALAQAVSTDKELGKGREEIDKEISLIRAQLQTAQPKGSEIKSSLERISAIGKVVGTVATTANLLQKIPTLIDFITTHFHTLESLGRQF